MTQARTVLKLLKKAAIYECLYNILNTKKMSNLFNLSDKEIYECPLGGYGLISKERFIFS